jgi:hypothetical protein
MSRLRKVSPCMSKVVTLGSSAKIADVPFPWHQRNIVPSGSRHWEDFHFHHDGDESSMIHSLSNGQTPAGSQTLPAIMGLYADHDGTDKTFGLEAIGVYEHLLSGLGRPTLVRNIQTAMFSC